MKNKEEVSKAVALQYKPANDNAPKVIAKGRGYIAELIKRVATEQNIPIYEDKVLVEMLEKIEINYEIPEFLYEVIAEILAFTYSIGIEGVQK